MGWGWVKAPHSAAATAMKKPAAGCRKRPATVKPKVEKAKAKPKQRTRVLAGTKSKLP